MGIVRRQCWLGIDGTRTGWVCFLLGKDEQYELWHVAELKDVELLTKRFDIKSVAVDIPLGLADVAERGGRGCDREARRLLSLAKRNAVSRKKTEKMKKDGLPLVGPSSIFTPPSRRAMAAFCDGATHSQVSEANKQSAQIEGMLPKIQSVGLGISIQTFHILPKIYEADTFLSPRNQESGQSLCVSAPTFECHPELAFLALSRKDASMESKKLSLDSTTALWSKKTTEGRRQRLDLLSKEGGLNAYKLLQLEWGKRKRDGELSSNAMNSLTEMRTWHVPSLNDEKQDLTSVAADDVLDAMICAISSRKWSLGGSRFVQEDGERQLDKRGIPMIIWC
jgi:predicted RNase H-like nuclease